MRPHAGDCTGGASRAGDSRPGGPSACGHLLAPRASHLPAGQPSPRDARASRASGCVGCARMIGLDVNTFIGAYPFRHVPHPDPDVLVRVLEREAITSAWT